MRGNMRTPSLLFVLILVGGIWGIWCPPGAAADTPPSTASDDELPNITPGPKMTLSEALSKTAEKNLTLAATRVEIEKAEASLSTAWGAVFPVVNGNVELLHRDHEDTFDLSGSMGDLVPMPAGADTETVITPLNDLKGSLQVSVPLVNFPAWYGISVAKQGVSIAEGSLETAKRYQLLAVCEAYYMALMARELIDLHLTAIESARQHLTVSKAKLDAGAGLRIDVLRAETDLDGAKQQLLSAHLAYDKARDALAVMTMTDGLPLPVETGPLPVPDQPDDALVTSALTSRPDYTLKQQQVAIAEKQLDGVWMKFLPSLSAAWQGTYQFTEPGDLGSSDRSRWIALFTLSVPLYNQMRYGELDRKRAEVRQAAIHVEEAKQSISLEIRNARRDYLTSLTAVEIAERRAALSREALALAEAAFEAGTGSSLDVTESRRTTTSANVDLSSKRLQSQLSLLKLLNAIGADLSQKIGPQ